jgi:RNA polymerase sigma factor (sigma-70 family)
MCYQADLEDLQPKIKAFVLSRVTNKCDACDVIQDINRVIIEKESEFDVSRDFNAWGMGIARFQILAYLTKIKRNKNVSFNTLLEGYMQEKNGSVDSCEGQLKPIDDVEWLINTPLYSLVEEEMSTLLKKIVKILTPPQRRVFRLLCQGFSHTEICTELNMNYGSVTAHKRRLINRAKDYLKTLHLTNKYDYRKDK